MSLDFLKKKRNKRKGNSVITLPLLIAFSTISIAALGIFLINILKPFIMYEKLLSTSLRYMFVIEEYGYLNSKDKEKIIKDLENQGFERKNIKIQATSLIQEYGNKVELEITYKYNTNLSFFKTNTLSLKKKKKEVLMRVVKYGVSKI